MILVYEKLYEYQNKPDNYPLIEIAQIFSIVKHLKLKCPTDDNEMAFHFFSLLLQCLNMKLLEDDKLSAKTVFVVMHSLHDVIERNRTDQPIL